MQVYVINLDRSVERRNKMKNMLDVQQNLSYEFVSAVDGRKLDKHEIPGLFDLKRIKYISPKDVLPGEIGCTLSHQKCYKKMIMEGCPYVLILEDDIDVLPNLSDFIQVFDELLLTEKPVVVLLSGLFWYFGKNNISANHIIMAQRKIVNVLDGALTHAYLVNISAAKKMICDKPFFRADDWRVFKHMGVTIWGFVPHLINHDHSESTIQFDSPIRYRYVFGVLRNMLRGVVRRIFVFIDKYEPEY